MNIISIFLVYRFLRDSLRLRRFNRASLFDRIGFADLGRAVIAPDAFHLEMRRHALHQSFNQFVIHSGVKAQ